MPVQPCCCRPRSTLLNVVVALTLVLWRGSAGTCQGIATATMTGDRSDGFFALGLMLASGASPGHVRWSELIDAKSLRRLFALRTATSFCAP